MADVPVGGITFNTDQFHSFVNQHYPQSYTGDDQKGYFVSDDHVHDHVRDELGLQKEDDVTNEHYTRFITHVVEPNPGMHEAWKQHLESYQQPPQQQQGPSPSSRGYPTPAQDEGYEVEVVGVEEMPQEPECREERPSVVFNNSATGAQSRGHGQSHSRRTRTVIEPSFAAAGRNNRSSATGAYMHLPTFEDKETNTLRTHGDSKLLLVELRIHKNVKDYVGWKPENVPESPFIISEDAYKKLLQAPRLVMPPRGPQFCETPLSINNRVTFRIVSDDARDIQRHQRARPRVQYPPAWVQTTLAAPSGLMGATVPPVNPPFSSSTGSGRVYHGSVVHPRSTSTGRFVDRQSTGMRGLSQSMARASLSSANQDDDDEAKGAQIRADLHLNDEIEDRVLGKALRWGEGKALQSIASTTPARQQKPRAQRPETKQAESATGRAMRSSGHKWR